MIFFSILMFHVTVMTYIWRYALRCCHVIGWLDVPVFLIKWTMSVYVLYLHCSVCQDKCRMSRRVCIIIGKCSQVLSRALCESVAWQFRSSRSVSCEGNRRSKQRAPHGASGGKKKKKSDAVSHSVHLSTKLVDIVCPALSARELEVQLNLCHRTLLWRHHGFPFRCRETDAARLLSITWAQKTVNSAAHGAAGEHRYVFVVRLSE